MLDLKLLSNAPRLLIEAELHPVQTDRFQPTGFPDLGPATYTLADDTAMLLVESPQSMANRAESACWDETRGEPVAALKGLPYVHVDVMAGDERIAVTSSMLEAHRLNSPYVLDGTTGDNHFKDLFIEATGYRADRPIDREKLARAIFRFDPASLLHGLFMSNVGDGRIRLARAMGAFIEARQVHVAPSGGVKNDRVNASGDTKEGFGNVPFARTEFTAATITAFMNLDLRQLRSFALPPEAFNLLVLLAQYKLQKLLRDQLRLRTACDLDVKQPPRVTAPEGYQLPSLEVLEAALPEAIGACAKLFAEPRVTRLQFATTAASTRKSKKEEKAGAKGKGV